MHRYGHTHLYTHVYTHGYTHTKFLGAAKGVGHSVCQVLAAQAWGLELRCSVPTSKVEHCVKCLQLQCWDGEYEMASARLLEFAGHSSSNRWAPGSMINLSPQIKWRVIEEDTQCQPLAHTCMLVCTCTHMYITHYIQCVHVYTYTSHTAFF